MTTMDHRRAVADRNRAAILDATERVLGRGQALNMVAVASEAGVSRPTLYAHFKTLPEVVEAAVQRSVDQSLSAIAAADPEEGPADAALMRLVDASWGQLARFEALARGVLEHLPADHVHRTHAPLMELMAELVERGKEEGTIRADLPTEWLVTTYFALVHSAADYARNSRVKRDDVLEMLQTTMRDLFSASGGAR